MARSILAGDPFAVRLRAGSSLRLKNGCAQDDATVGTRCDVASFLSETLGLEQRVEIIRMQSPSHRLFTRQFLLEHELCQRFFHAE
jgi:hypothetical protein